MQLTAIVSTIAVVIIVGLGVGLKIEHKAKIKAQTELIQIKAIQKTEHIRQLGNKKKADEDTKRFHRELDIVNKRLRDILSGSNFTGSSGNSEVVCFDRTKLDSAIRSFAERTGNLIGRGDEAITDLNTAKQWAQRN